MPFARTHVTAPAQLAVPQLVADLRRGLAGEEAVAVVYFASPSYAPEDLAGPISRSFPAAAVIGCSSAGEFTDLTYGEGGISAVAFPPSILHGAVAALGDLSQDAAAGTAWAVYDIEDQLGVQLRDLDPSRHLGLVLIEGLHGSEEQVNETLGYAAPLLDIVGGSAGDDLTFASTWVAAGERVNRQGVALLICEPAAGFTIVKTCSFVPSGRRLRITSADVAARRVDTFDGRPAAEAYAEALGLPIGAFGPSAWAKHPLGLMINGQAWIRSPRALTDGGGVAFYAQIHPGMEVEVMDAADLLADLRCALREARAKLAGPVAGAIMFNCILRRLEIDAQGGADSFLAALAGIPAAGFHTYGESWIGHVNQTLTGVLFGGTRTS